MTDTAFPADRTTYIRSHAKTAAFAMAGAMGVLWLMGDPNIWVGAVAGLAGIGLRGWFLASEELAAVWSLGEQNITGPMERNIDLAQIAKLRCMGSFVQIITHSGDKHLIKYQADPEATKAQIARACPKLPA